MWKWYQGSLTTIESIDASKQIKKIEISTNSKGKLTDISQLTIESKNASGQAVTSTNSYANSIITIEFTAEAMASNISILLGKQARVTKLVITYSE